MSIELNPGKISDNLLYTMTGEPFQPLRLYYQIHNEKIWLGRFQRLKSVQWDPAGDRGVWLYRQEAAAINLPYAPADVPKAYRPAVLASLTRQGAILQAEVRSVERALALAAFFKEKINRRVLSLHRFRIVNQLFSQPSRPASAGDRPAELDVHLDLEALFNPPDLKSASDEDFEAQIKAIQDQYEDPDERTAAVNAFLDESSQKPLPKVEELPCHIYEEGIQHLELMVRMRQIVAYEHWQGNTSFTQMDAIQRAFGIDQEDG